MKHAPFISKAPIVDRLEKDHFETIETGDHVRVQADRGFVTVTGHEKTGSQL